MINLISNAMKFTFTGHIKVIASYKEVEHQLEVRIKDTGIGISDEDRSKLFKMFGKLHSSSSINSTGIGLGLNICKNLVEALGGKIYILDEPQENGTTMVFTIKVVPPASNSSDYLSRNFQTVNSECLMTSSFQDIKGPGTGGQDNQGLYENPLAIMSTRTINPYFLNTNYEPSQKINDSIMDNEE